MNCIGMQSWKGSEYSRIPSMLSFCVCKCCTRFWICLNIAQSQPANIGPQDIPRTSFSNVPRTSPKDPIWPSRGPPDLMSRERPNLTSWGRPEMMSSGRPNLTFQARPWEVDSGRPQDALRTSLRGFSEYSNSHVAALFVTFLSELIRLTKSI